MEALSLSEHATFIERHMRMIVILLSSHIPRDLPLKAGIIVSAQAKVKLSGGAFIMAFPTNLFCSIPLWSTRIVMTYLIPLEKSGRAKLC